MEDNEITGNGFSGVEIHTGGNPVLRRNQIHANKESGVYVHDGGLGMLEGNEITGNGYSGVEVETDWQPGRPRQPDQSQHGRGGERPPRRARAMWRTTTWPATVGGAWYIDKRLPSRM